MKPTELQEGQLYYYTNSESPIPVYVSSDPEDNTKAGILERGHWFLYLGLIEQPKEMEHRPQIRYIECLIEDQKYYLCVSIEDSIFDQYTPDAAEMLKAEAKAKEQQQNKT